jgi:hypothetical protein
LNDFLFFEVFTMRVLNFSHTKGIPEGAIYIGRNARIWAESGQTGAPRYGNPFVMGRDGNREEVVAKHRAWLEEQMKSEEFCNQMLEDLAGKDLVCHCAPEACHGHTLREKVLELQAARERALQTPERTASDAGAWLKAAIIGTAGRRDDAARLNAAVYTAMLEDARARIRDLGGRSVSLTSAGAAYADHIAVRLYLDGEVSGLTLHLPAEMRDGRFVENPGERFDVGRTANYYHRQFKQKTGVDGMAEIQQAIAMGAVVNVKKSFKERNTLVAQEADVVIAYTFGPSRQVTDVMAGERGFDDPVAGGLKDGGTADTWSKATGAIRKIHVPIQILGERQREAATQATLQPTRGRQDASRQSTAQATPSQGSFAFAEDAASAIESFNGDHRFLSNFWPARVVLDGVEYPTVEHAYQAAKTVDPAERRTIADLPTPGQAKRAGKQVTMRADWDEVKIDLMRDLVRQKFRHPELAGQLLATGEARLIEGNRWGDRFWGQSPVGNGENHLGRILMEVRRELREMERDTPSRPSQENVETGEVKISADSGQTRGEVSTSTDVKADTAKNTENTLTGLKGTQMPTRAEFERVANASINVFTTAVEEGLPQYLSANPGEHAELRSAIRLMSETLVSNKLVSRSGPDRRWVGHADRLGAVDDAVFEKLIGETRALIESMSADTVAALSAEGKAHTLAAIGTLNTEMAETSLKTPFAEPLAAALSGDTQATAQANVQVETPAAETAAEAPVEAPAPVEEIPVDRLHAVASASLRVLEATHKAGARIEPQGRFADLYLAREDLVAALRNASYLVPGDSTVRTAPYSEQTPRGTREELEAIHAAAGAFAAALGDRDTADLLPLETGDSNMARIGILTGLDALDRAIESATPAPPVVDEAQSESVQSEILPPEMAAKIVDAIDASDQIIGRAQIDTDNHNSVMLSMEDLEELREALQQLGDPEIGAVLKDIRDDLVAVPGLSADQAGLVLGAINQLYDLVDLSDVLDQGIEEQKGLVERPIETSRSREAVSEDGEEAEVEHDEPSFGDADHGIDDESPFDDIDGGGHKETLAGRKGFSDDLEVYRIPMSEVDRVSNTYRMLVESGAHTGLSILAGREETDRNALLAGRGVAEFATIQEAISAGRGLHADATIGLARKPMPEMNMAHYRSLQPADKIRTRPFIVEPGRGIFDGYQSTSISDPKVARYRRARIRTYVNDRLAQEKAGKVTDAKGRKIQPLHDSLLGLHRRAIVAPHIDEARVIRDISNKLLKEYQDHLKAKRESYLAGADRTVVQFDGKDVDRFLRAIDASSSAEPATLTKRDGTVVLEHPEAPTITGTIDRESRLDKARDGYRLHKVHPEAIRLAEGAKAMRIHLEDDRPATIDPIREDDKVSEKAAEKNRKARVEERV